MCLLNCVVFNAQKQEKFIFTLTYFRLFPLLALCIMKPRLWVFFIVWNVLESPRGMTNKDEKPPALRSGSNYFAQYQAALAERTRVTHCT